MTLKNMKALNLMLLLLVPFATIAAEPEFSTRKAVKANPKQEYYLIDHSQGKEPEGGYKLLLVLPGGDGSAGFNPFVTNIGKHATDPDYLIAQLIAVKWTPDQQIVWPTKEAKARGTEFTTEEFLSAVISDITNSNKVNPRHIYTLSWSSGGPASYAASITVDEIKGSFVAMSVFKPDQLPRLSGARGHRYFIYHSPEDKVCPIRMAEDAKEQLAKKGAEVKLITYEGGHGWHGNVFGAIRKGIAWLENR